MNRGGGRLALETIQPKMFALIRSHRGWLELDVVDSGQSETYTHIAVGTEHGCALRDDGAVHCWGHNVDKDGSDACQARPPGGTYVAITAGDAHTCALDREGRAVCWGSNLESWHHEVVDQARPPDRRFSAIAAGESHTCGILNNGELLCWGSDRDGKASAPEGRFVKVSAGRHFSCALRDDGAAVCWGRDRDGSLQPPQDEFVEIGVGAGHACGVTVEGELRCWGSNDVGQSDPPPGMFDLVSASSRYSCGLVRDGTLLCWGSDLAGRADPPEGSFASLDTALVNGCAITSEGELRCWGSNEAGQSDPYAQPALWFECTPGDIIDRDWHDLPSTLAWESLFQRIRRLAAAPSLCDESEEEARIFEETCEEFIALMRTEAAHLGSMASFPSTYAEVVLNLLMIRLMEVSYERLSNGETCCNDCYYEAAQFALFLGDLENRLAAVLSTIGEFEPEQRHLICSWVPYGFLVSYQVHNCANLPQSITHRHER